MIGRAEMLVLVVALGATASCISDPTVPCGALSCPAAEVCTPGGCAPEAAVEACAGKPDTAPCTDAAIATGVCRGGACFAVICGDGRVDPGEACDDGNTVSGDGCSADCKSNETCGNGIVDPITGEQCDSGRPGLSGTGCSSRCQTEFASWSDITPAPIAGRAMIALAFDAARGEVVTFGGFSETQNLGDTWVWDGFEWSPRLPARSPSARYGYALAYDSVREQVVLFGGYSATGGALGDTWVWDGTTWAERQPAHSPSPRGGTALAFDPIRARLVLFGNASSIPAAGETWEWDGVDWTERTPATSPPNPTDTIAMVWDATNLQVMLFDAPDTWEWDGNVWTNLAPADHPEEQGAFAMAPAVGNAVILFGGYSGDTLETDTWQWNGTDWALLAPPSGDPPARDYGGMAFDSLHQATVLFGGYTFTSTTESTPSDTWTWSGSDWAVTASALLLSPPERAYHAMTYDARRGRAVLFGGWDSNASTPYADDTWVDDANGWSRASVGGQQPPRRSDHALAYDSARDRVVLFGGYVPGTGSVGDTWELDGTTWVQASPMTVPSAREDHQLIYDARLGVTVLFGGLGPSSSFADTWEWDGTSWTDVTPATGSPPARYAFGMAYDSSRDRVVVFGGVDVSSSFLADTWEWDGTSWTELSPATSPPPSVFCSMTYDPVQRRVVLLGAQSNWLWDGTQWTEQELQSTAPQFDAAPPMVFDPIRHSLVMFGGYSLIFGPTSATWAGEVRAPGTSVERCLLANEDADGDGLAGCADPDCWGRCDPLCPPGDTCPAVRPHCGDGTCDPVEDALICPADCPAL